MIRLNIAKSGLTLVEVLISMLVIGVGCLAVLTIHISVIRSYTLADKMNLAINLAQSELERIKSLTFSELTHEAQTNAVTVNKVNKEGQTCPQDSDCLNYPYTRTTHYYPFQPTRFSHHVEVEVSWRDLGGIRQVFYIAVMSNFSL